MENDNWDYGAGEQIDPKIISDYESPDFDIGGVADDYEEKDSSRKTDDRREDSFLNPDERLKNWEFDGVQVEKHSRGSRRKRRKQERKASEAAAAEETKKAEEAAAAEEAKKAEEAAAAEEERRIEAERQAAFERISKTVQAPIASTIVGNESEEPEKPDEYEPNVSPACADMSDEISESDGSGDISGSQSGEDSHGN